MTLINKLKEIILHFFSIFTVISENSGIKRDLLSLQTEKIRDKISVNELMDLIIKIQGRFPYEE